MLFSLAEASRRFHTVLLERCHIGVIGFGLFNEADVTSLQILDRHQLEHFLIVQVLDDEWHFTEECMALLDERTECIQPMTSKSLFITAVYLSRDGDL